VAYAMGTDLFSLVESSADSIKKVVENKSFSDR